MFRGKRGSWELWKLGECEADLQGKWSGHKAWLLPAAESAQADSTWCTVSPLSSLNLANSQCLIINVILFCLQNKICSIDKINVVRKQMKLCWCVFSNPYYCTLLPPQLKCIHRSHTVGWCLKHFELVYFTVNFSSKCKPRSHNVFCKYSSQNGIR